LFETILKVGKNNLANQNKVLLKQYKKSPV